VPRSPHRPESLALRVFRGDEAIQSGAITAERLRSSAWIRKRYNVYADARLEDDHALSCRAAAIVLPSGTAIAGRSAAYLLGVLHAADRASDVELYPRGESRLGHREGIRVHTGILDPPDLIVAGGLTCTSGARTGWDVARWLRAVDAVPIIDTLLGLGAVTSAELDAYARDRLGLRGSRRAETALTLTDGRAQSPRESELRVRLVVAGLPKPVAQLAIVLPGGLVLHPDLAWEEYRVAVEYDGLWHATADQLHRDRRRLNQLVGAGWIVLHVTSQRLRTDMPGIVREVRAALISRGWRPRSG
jgi:Protein of unknown function (DUF559)